MALRLSNICSTTTTTTTTTTTAAAQQQVPGALEDRHLPHGRAGGCSPPARSGSVLEAGVDLAPDLASGMRSGVHVDVAVAGLDEAQHAGEVAGRHALAGRADDVRGGHGPVDGAAPLRA